MSSTPITIARRPGCARGRRWRNSCGRAGGGGRFLRRQEHRPADRRAARRRLRHLCTRARPASRPPHPRPADDRVEEHAGRRQRAGRQASSARSLPRTAPRSPPSCPGAVMGPLLDEKAEALFDPTKVHYLGTANNGTRVCVTLQGLQDQDLRRRAHAEGRVRRRLDQRFDPRIRLHAQEAPPARSTTWCPAIAAPPRSRWRWSAARSTASAAGTGRASSRRSPTGCATTRSTCCCRSGSSRIPSSPAGRAVGVQIRQERGGPQSGGAGDQPAGVPALLYRAARHRRRSSSTPCARPSTRR